MEQQEDLRERLKGPLLSRLRQAAALCLWEKGAVKVNTREPFKLASGNLSPIYVNCRAMVADPAFLRLFAAVSAMILERRGARFDALAGGETAGIPFAYALGTELAKPALYVRKKAKSHGIATRLEGELPAPGARVLLVEDLITDGGSKMTFIEALRAAGAVVEDALVLFDREQGGTELLAREGVRLHSVTDRKTAFAVGHSAGLLDETTISSIEDYVRDPAAWHAARGYQYQAAEA
jgi:orotate phosphoribosyltransferase